MTVPIFLETEMFVKPSFYDDFKCKADKCTDSCCIGWEIDIDDVTLEKYRMIDGDLGERLRKFIVTDGEYSYFKLCDGERCPFLCENGLCDIYNNLGEDALCDICTEHPRFYNEIGDVTLAGLGLCCEKVCELLFDSNYILGFIADDTCISDIFEEMLDVIKHKEYDIFEKMNSVLELAGYTEKLYLDSKMLKRIINAFLSTEPINDEWTSYINSLSESHSEFSIDCLDLYSDDYSKLLGYVLYRHLPESEYDGDTALWTLFCCLSVCFVMISDMFTYKLKGVYSLQDRIDNVKRWSKQIEYSTENINIIMADF